jgi:hippurate hydrolase
MGKHQIKATDKKLDKEFLDRIVEIRRDLHQYPELSWQEHKTHQKIISWVKELGINNFREVAGTGLIVDIEGKNPDKVVALRADIDALPIEEASGLEFSSQNVGVMHACGHDGHTAILLGAAELLLRQSPMPCNIRLIFQPAEEVGTGANAMIREGALDDVQMIFGVHIDLNYPAGNVVAVEGPVNASADRFSIRLLGKGGHAARPHQTRDALVGGAQLVMALQTVVSRELDPGKSGVLTVGQFKAGQRHNIISGEAYLEGTVRTQEEAVREQIFSSLHRIAASIGELHELEVQVEMHEGTPAVINLEEPARLARRAAEIVVGENGLRELPSANMSGEDFGFYLEKVAGCFVRLGARPQGEVFPAHSSRFHFDEKVLGTGANFMVQVAKSAGEFLTS